MNSLCLRIRSKHFPQTSRLRYCERIAAIVREKEVERVVVGLPRNMNGTMGPAATEALEFVDRLRAKLLLPCRYVG